MLLENHHSLNIVTPSACLNTANHSNRHEQAHSLYHHYSCCTGDDWNLNRDNRFIRDNSSKTISTAIGKHLELRLYRRKDNPNSHQKHLELRLYRLKDNRNLTLNNKKMTQPFGRKDNLSLALNNKKIML